jgi:hypothetical protein
VTVPLPRPPRVPATLRRRGLLLAVGAVALLAACTPLKAGSAAVVGEVALTETQVSDYAEEITSIAQENDLQPPAGADLNGRIVGLWVEETLTEELARREGVTVADGDVDAFLAQFSDDDLNQIAVSSGIGPSTIDRAARSQLLQQALAQKLVPAGSPEQQSAALRAALAEVATDVGVSVNPRYGSFDAKTAQVGPRLDVRLSSPQPSDSAAPQVTPTPAG